jgi:hypothetical protein
VKHEAVTSCPCAAESEQHLASLCINDSFPDASVMPMPHPPVSIRNKHKKMKALNGDRNMRCFGFALGPREASRCVRLNEQPMLVGLMRVELDYDPSLAPKIKLG